MKEFLTTGDDKIVCFRTKEEDVEFATGMLKKWDEAESVLAPISLLKKFKSEIAREAEEASRGEDFRIWFGKDFYVIFRRRTKGLALEAHVRSVGVLDIGGGPLSIDQAIKQLDILNEWCFETLEMLN